MAQASAKLTYEDYLKLPDDGKRYEIINGELYVSPAPGLRHQRIFRRIFTALSNYFDAHGGGELFAAPTDVVLSKENVVQPDILVIKSDRAGIASGERNVAGAPNLVIEVLSPSTHRVDEVQKRKLYERAGVDEYWIADPERKLVTIYRRSGDAFTRVAEISTETGGAITSPLLPGFALDVNDVFARE